MARVFFALIPLICMFQTLSAVPLHLRAVAPPDCNQIQVGIILGIERARTSLGPINTANDIGNARLLLQAQLSLLDANNGTTEIQLGSLSGEPPAPADTNARIVAGLQAAQAALNHTAFFSSDNATASAVQTASSSISDALVSAQQAVDTNCTKVEE
ncbi:hypothetical protein FB451DRAFT_1553859 [Mycena latifolia]|nr:hypothetical protein FB451DRAFT_1553859 [Mycena latifolia]